MFSQAFNRRWRRCGHLFQGRFFSLHVQRDSHLLELLRYTALNPVRAGLVKAPGEWRWGSHRATAGLEERPAWLATDWTLSQFGGRRRPETTWARFVADVSTYSPWERVRSQVILGEDDLVDELRARVAEVRETGGIPSSQLRLGAESLAEATKRLAGFLHPTRTGSAAKRDRALAVVVLRDACLASYRQIGELTGLTMWGARSLVDRGRTMAHENSATKKRLGEFFASTPQPGRREHKTQP